MVLSTRRTAEHAAATAEQEFAAFAYTHAGRLRAAAYLLCRDWHFAQDLTQTALTRLFLCWQRARQAGNLPAYAHKILLRAYLDHRRRRWSAEALPGELLERELREPAGRDSADLRLTMLAALDRLPARDRAIVLLRYFEDYTVEQVAEALDLPAGVVKSQTRRSLARLRRMLAEEQRTLFAA